MLKSPKSKFMSKVGTIKAINRLKSKETKTNPRKSSKSEIDLKIHPT